MASINNVAGKDGGVEAPSGDGALNVTDLSNGLGSVDLNKDSSIALGSNNHDNQLNPDVINSNQHKGSSPRQNGQHHHHHHHSPRSTQHSHHHSGGERGPNANAQPSGAPVKVEIAKCETVDTEQALLELAKRLASEEIAGVDCEGEKLSRSGRLCLLQIALPSKKQSEEPYSSVDIYLVDAVSLGGQLFTEHLKDFFEGKIVKVMHDCRMDSDALFHQFGITLGNVFDLQCAFATLKRQQWEKNPKYRPERPFVEPFPVSFAKLLKLYCNVLHESKNTIRTAMNEDTTFWAQRPLTESMIEYASSDVQYLLSLYMLLEKQILPEYIHYVTQRSVDYCHQIRSSVDGVQGLGFQPQQTYYKRAPHPPQYYPNYQPYPYPYQYGAYPYAQQLQPEYYTPYPDAAAYYQQPQHVQYNNYKGGRGRGGHGGNNHGYQQRPKGQNRAPPPQQ